MYIKKRTSRVVLEYGQAEVRTEAGMLRGVISDGTYIFRGIEYAEAERFHLPRKVTPWTGVKEAIVYGNACPEHYTVIPHDQYTVPHYFTVQSEDCQYLNVWTQHLNTTARRPVMVCSPLPAPAVFRVSPPSGRPEDRSSGGRSSPG